MSDLREVLQRTAYLRQKQIFADCDRYQRAVSTLLSIAAAVAGADYDAGA